jgi:Xaa-Pro dipeptidase
MMHRRSFLALAPAAVLVPQAALAAPKSKPGPAGLTSMTGASRPIGAAERQARIAKLQRLLVEAHVGALIVESGSTLDYFTGVQWRRSERTTAAVIPAKGEVVLVTPFFEEPSVHETLAVAGEIRTWNEHESPFERLVGALKDRGAGAGDIAFEDTTRAYIIDGVMAAGPALRRASGTQLVRACRLIKSPAEIALMQTANEITLAALKHTHAAVKPGMAPAEIEALMVAATRALGGVVAFNDVLINEASAYPHGSRQPQKVREGSVVLIDTGCSVHGYQSDITRTWVVGQPSARQRKVWDTVKRGQEVALEAAKPGVPVGTIDDAVRAYYEKEGWGPGYKLPGLSHRTGHGIGMDVHEPPYLVHGDATPLEAGMCFSDEPGIYIPGEFGIRLEDCWHMTSAGPKTFTPLARSIEDPI